MPRGGVQTLAGATTGTNSEQQRTDRLSFGGPVRLLDELGRGCQVSPEEEQCVTVLAVPGVLLLKGLTNPVLAGRDFLPTERIRRGVEAEPVAPAGGEELVVIGEVAVDRHPLTPASRPER